MVTARPSARLTTSCRRSCTDMMRSGSSTTFMRVTGAGTKGVERHQREDGFGSVGEVASRHVDEAAVGGGLGDGGGWVVDVADEQVVAVPHTVSTAEGAHLGN